MRRLFQVFPADRRLSGSPDPKDSHLSLNYREESSVGPASSRPEKDVSDLAFAIVVFRGDRGEEGILAEGVETDLSNLSNQLWAPCSDRSASQSKIC
jgi:hypothetical protein